LNGHATYAFFYIELKSHMKGRKPPFLNDRKRCFYLSSEKVIPRPEKVTEEEVH